MKKKRKDTFAKFSKLLHGSLDVIQTNQLKGSNTDNCYGSMRALFQQPTPRVLQ